MMEENFLQQFQIDLTFTEFETSRIIKQLLEIINYLHSIFLNYYSYMFICFY
jgi:serine/threonine protein kinase